MSRSYTGKKLKKNRVYSGQDLQQVYSVSANTISNWVKTGLRPSDDKRPYLFRGGCVMDFHRARQERAKTKLRPGEFKCTGCKSAVFPDVSSLEELRTKNGALMGMARCSECGCHVRKFISQADLEVFEQLHDPNTTVDSLREGKRTDLGGIWSSEEKDGHDWGGANDRILFNWQFHAGYLAEQTIDQHLAAIRFMEDVLAGKSFDHLTIRDVDVVRSALKDALAARGDGQKSRSTVSHQASHIMAFLEWLIVQDGYKRLPKDLPGYMKMPKAIYAKAMPKTDKAYLSIEEAGGFLTGMACVTTADKRARAMFAIAFLGALRADTITSLRVCHFDTENRQIIQDATASRTKNGKSLRINWFPISESFIEAVNDWVEIITKAGLRGQDALFPSFPSLKSRKDLKLLERDPVEPMTSKDAVTKAFASACRNSVVKYNPHSVKDTLAAERDRRPLTQPQRKAWSENMGHESEKITETHYGKLSDEERVELFEEIAESKPAGQRTMTNEEKIELMDNILDALNGR
ncbi:hypothetical protein A9Q94_04975 [Rhodobacterales bacterium 56_14_T64]|nr:hypothetical protein A9Q94_04975 [Rhodobacterales bacterium 56_14_T64]